MKIRYFLIGKIVTNEIHFSNRYDQSAIYRIGLHRGFGNFKSVTCDVYVYVFFLLKSIVIKSNWESGLYSVKVNIPREQCV